MPSNYTKELEEILLNYRSLVADLVQDRHDRGISTEELKAIDDKARLATEALLEKAQKYEIKQCRQWLAELVPDPLHKLQPAADTLPLEAQIKDKLMLFDDRLTQLNTGASENAQSKEE